MEIKFRGKQVDSGEWYVGFYAKGRHGGHYILSEYNGLATNAHSVDGDTLGRCADLKDTDGVEVFEGDVLRQKTVHEFKGSNPSAWERRYIVRFGRCDFRPRETGCDTLGFFLADIDGYSFIPKGIASLEWDNAEGYDFEVIGNIHDNPELLEVAA